MKYCVSGIRDRHEIPTELFGTKLSATNKAEILLCEPDVTSVTITKVAQAHDDLPPLLWFTVETNQAPTGIPYEITPGGKTFIWRCKSASREQCLAELDTFQVFRISEGETK